MAALVAGVRFARAFAPRSDALPPSPSTPSSCSNEGELNSGQSRRTVSDRRTKSSSAASGTTVGDRRNTAPVQHPTRQGHSRMDTAERSITSSDDNIQSCMVAASTCDGYASCDDRNTIADRQTSFDRDDASSSHRELSSTSAGSHEGLHAPTAGPRASEKISAASYSATSTDFACGVEVIVKDVRDAECKFGMDSAEVAAHLRKLALLLEDDGQKELAWMLWKRVLEIQTCTLGDEHPDLAVTRAKIPEMFVFSTSGITASTLCTYVLTSHGNSAGKSGCSTLLDHPVEAASMSPRSGSDSPIAAGSRLRAGRVHGAGTSSNAAHFGVSVASWPASIMSDTTCSIFGSALRHAMSGPGVAATSSSPLAAVEEPRLVAPTTEAGWAATAAGAAGNAAIDATRAVAGEALGVAEEAGMPITSSLAASAFSAAGTPSAGPWGLLRMSMTAVRG